jgi:hypothetical protein
MNVERVLDDATGLMELWQYEWTGPTGSRTKRRVRRLGVEPPPSDQQMDAAQEVRAICWAFGGTMGNIAVYSPEVLGTFPDAPEGDDARLACNIISAGKFRNGADRYWCTVHQEHWGKQADLADFEAHGVVRCPNHDMQMSYVREPVQIDLREHPALGVWCSLPPAISSKPIEKRPPMVHVHSREEVDGPKQIDDDFRAIALVHNGGMNLFGPRIRRINVTPPAIFEFVDCFERGQEMTTVDCSHCGFPHLDLGSFSREPHRKHACGNCGRDSTWSKDAVISNPLQRIFDAFTKNKDFVVPDRHLDLDTHDGKHFEVWASTPAAVWTASRPQEKGIHVHVYDDAGGYIVNETFGSVTYQGKLLDRDQLYAAMKEATLI